MKHAICELHNKINPLRCNTTMESSSRCMLYIANKNWVRQQGTEVQEGVDKEWKWNAVNSAKRTMIRQMTVAEGGGRMAAARKGTSKRGRTGGSAQCRQGVKGVRDWWVLLVSGGVEVSNETRQQLTCGRGDGSAK
jgi:hypothetical protein